MTATLITFDTTNADKQQVTVELFYDKHELFCVGIRTGNLSEGRDFEIKKKHCPDLLPALKAYNLQKKKHTVQGIERTERITSLYDQVFRYAKAQDEALSSTPMANRVSKSDVSYFTWEGIVYQKIEEHGDMNRSDAQGIAMMHEGNMKSWYHDGYAAEVVAKMILSLSKV